MKRMVKVGAALMVAMVFAVIVVDTASARGRTGSHRYGGYTSHGKGSHYYGGH